RKITLDGEAYDVIGVMPKDFKFPQIWGEQAEFWRPITFDLPEWKKSRGNHWFWVLGRLKNGISLARASADMETLSERLAQQYPDTNTGVIAKVVGLREQLAKNARPALLVLFATVGFLLLIACVNVANLLLAKAVGRQREIAIRLAVGSGRWRLIRQLLTESARSVAAPHQRSRRLLTAGEIALALMMLIAAGLSIRSLVRLLGVQAGFDPQNVLTARIALPESRYPKPDQATSFYERLLARIRALPGVRSASLTGNLPLEGGSNGTLIIEGQPTPKNMWSSPLVEWDPVMPGYFSTLRIPLLRGRDFAAQDTKD